MIKKRGKHYLEIAAIKGHAKSRHMLGTIESKLGNDIRAAKHWIIAAEAGLDDSLEEIRKCYMQGIVSKDDYAKTLRVHQKSKDKQESKNRANEL